MDSTFDKLEANFRTYEKAIKLFGKDTSAYLFQLKEFFKAQTIIAESAEEYYADAHSPSLKHYVYINASVLNQIYNINVQLCLSNSNISFRPVLYLTVVVVVIYRAQINFFHTSVLQPLNELLKYLDIPNKLITKRHDKLLDYECARANIHKLKDKNLVDAVYNHLCSTFDHLLFCLLF